MKPNKSLLRSSVLEAVLLLISIPLFSFLFFQLRLPRQVGLVLRYDLPVVFISLFLLGYFFFRLPGTAGKILAPAFLAITFVLPLSGLWASGNSEQYVIGGILPASDSMLYDLDALRFLNGHLFSSFSADKPLSPSLTALTLWITGQSPRSALILILVLPILATYLAMREIQRSHGTLVAAAFLPIVFLYYRPYIGTYMTETLGLSLGLLAFAFLIRYTIEQKLLWFCAGLTCLTLALFARQGALLVLPLVIFWFVWKIRKQLRQSARKIALVILAVGIGVLGNHIVFSTVSDPKTTTNSTLPLHLYSLATGGTYWSALTNEHPEMYQYKGSQYLLQGLRITFDYFIEHPKDLFIGIAKEYDCFFRDPQRGEYSFFKGSNDWKDMVFRSGAFVLTALGIAALFRPKYRNQKGLLLFCLVGLILSVPFVNPLHHFLSRCFSSTIWIEAFLFGLGVDWFSGIFSKWAGKMERILPPFEPTGHFPLTGFSAFLILVMIIGPVFIRLTAKPANVPAAACPAGEQNIAVRVESGSYITLVDHKDPRQGWLPYYRRSYFQLAIHNQPHSSVSAVLERPDQPTTIIFGMDLASHEKVIVIVPESLYSGKPGIISVCGNFEQNAGYGTEYFFNATSLKETAVPITFNGSLGELVAKRSEQ